MTDLASWLLAQIADDEAAARAAMDGSLGRWAAESDLGVGAVIDDRRGIVAYDEGRPTEAQAVHTATNWGSVVVGHVPANAPAGDTGPRRSPASTRHGRWRHEHARRRPVLGAGDPGL